MAEWLETWQKAMGVVPRTRYLELLEKADALERRVRELEETNRQLNALLEGREQQEESTQKMTELWGQMVENSMKSQSAWMEAWAKAEPATGSVPRDAASSHASRIVPIVLSRIAWAWTGHPDFASL